PVTLVQPSETVTPTDTGFPLIFWIIIGALVVFMMSVGIIAAKLPNE
ncbi:MAG: hypothetical protein HUU38_31305, partial [Anaerolineales bacterium]|nr:hypothetical protein [Anaerolineales bacterium]